MTDGVKDDGRRGWFGKKSRSSIGGSVYEKVTQELEPEHLLKTKSWKEKRRFQNKSQRSNGHGVQVYSETTDLEPAEEKLVQRTMQGFYRDDDGGPSPTILQTFVLAAREAVKEFSKDFASQMKAKPDLCVALEAQMRRQLNSEPADLKFLVQAYTVLHLFSGFENASFGISIPGEKPWEVDQHMATCFEQFKAFRNKTETISKLLENKAGDSFLSEFCTRKFKSLISVDVENAMFGADCELHSDLLDQKHPNSAFYRSFLSAAVSVWLLQRLRFSFEQKVITILPTRGDELHRRFMMPAVPGTGDNGDEASDCGLEVLYTLFPGFRVGESIVKSLVSIVEKSNQPTTEAETAVDQTPSIVETVAAEDQTASTVDNAASVEEVASTVNYSAVEETPGRNPTFLKVDSPPVTPSARKVEGSKINGTEISLSSRETSQSKGPTPGFFQTIRHQIRKKTSKKAKTADNFASPAVSPSLEDEPSAYQRTQTATTSIDGEPASTPRGTASEGELAAHQRIPTATTSIEGKPESTSTGTSSVEAEPPAHQRIPTATTSIEGEPANTPTGATSIKGEQPTHHTNPAATASVEGESAAHQSTTTTTKFAESAPAARDIPAAASMQGEISPVGEAPLSKSAPPAPPPKDGEIEVSSSPSPKGPPLITLD